MHDASGRTTYAYDAVGRVDHVTQPANKTITYSYDPVGNRSVMVDPDGGRTTYSYDGANRLTWLLNPFNERTTWVYDALGQVTSMTLGNGTSTTYAYVADTLDGQWRPLAASADRPFATTANITFEGEKWTDNVSHGELIRAGYDERLEIDPANLQLLFQGVLNPDRAGKPYGQIPWQLGLLTLGPATD